MTRLDQPTLFRVAPDVDLLPSVEAVVRWAGARQGGPSPPGGAAPWPDGAPAGTVLVLVPNLGWAERLSARLRRRGIPVAASWEEAASGWPVVVGARSAAWSPVARVAAVVVLDADDEAYREERAPTSNAWQVVAERARRDGAPCLLVSPCPSVVQIAQSELRPVPRAVERIGWPALVVLDRRGSDLVKGYYPNPSSVPP